MKLSIISQSLLLFVLLSLSVSAFGQTAARPRANQPQWEYLVVSFGKVYFSDPMSDTEAKSAGFSKLLSFSKAGIVIANEGLTTQRYMDTLGKFGWELVGALGAIGGDQEMLFKRPYDEGRSKQEEELIKQEGDRLQKVLEEERSKSAAIAPVTELVDLDEVERTAARNANRRAQEERVKTAAASITDTPLKMKSVLSNAHSNTDVDVTATFVLNATSQLLTEGNKYRSGAASQLGTNALQALLNAAGVRVNPSYAKYPTLGYSLGKVKVNIDVVITHNGKDKVVASVRSGGDW
jgi:hypothetical protein